MPRNSTVCAHWGRGIAHLLLTPVSHGRITPRVFLFLHAPMLGSYSNPSSGDVLGSSWEISQASLPVRGSINLWQASDCLPGFSSKSFMTLRRTLITWAVMSGPQTESSISVTLTGVGGIGTPTPPGGG